MLLQPDRRHPSLVRRDRPTNKRKQKHTTYDATKNRSRKRIRDIERRLRRDRDIPADVKNDLERELATRRAALQDWEQNKLRSSMIGKYHMVRFFERQKATRLARQLRKELDKTDASDTDTIERLEKELHVAEVDVAYAINYPYMEPYVSLYAKAKEPKDRGKSVPGGSSQTPTAKAALHSERPQMWAAVEEAMSEGEHALEKLRERGSEVGLARKMSQRDKTKMEKSRPNLDQAGGEKSQEGAGEKDGSDDDGGFFEE